VRDCALGYVGFPDSASRRPTSLVGVMNSHRLNDTRSGSPLRIITEIGSAFSTNQRESSVEADQRSSRSPRGSSRATVLSPMQCDSPVSRIKCDGWCGYDLHPCATVVSLSACADLQQAWEGPRGSLTAVLCRFLKTNPYPSYHSLMYHVNFQLHANCRALHEYTLGEKKKAARGEGPGFDGELNNFQAPQLSSLAKLNMGDTVPL